MKGAISCGDMSVNINQQIFFGQPLIDAYLLQEDVLFYGIVLHNSAERKLNEFGEDLLGYERYHDCLVSLKSGRIRHYILDWVVGINFEVEKEIAKNSALNLMKKHREKHRVHQGNILIILLKLLIKCTHSAATNSRHD